MFQVIGGVRDQSDNKVKRVLPDWLSNPTIISSDIAIDKSKVSRADYLDEQLRLKLKENNVQYLFPVQKEVIPYVLRTHSQSICCRPSDICISAPTGSGKTLAYVLPIIQVLQDRVVPKIRALIVLPVKELAKQVFKVFEAYVKGTDLKIGLAIGERNFTTEQSILVNNSHLYGYSSKVDILITTPGRLLDHLLNTPGFLLHDLRYFVLDEADRLMSESDLGWLDAVERSIYEDQQISSCQCRGDQAFTRFKIGFINPCAVSHISWPCQKLLYSATLSSNPTILQRLSLFDPKLFTSVPLDPQALPSEETNDNFIGRFTVPNELSEFSLICKDVELKPLLIWYLMHHKKFRRTLCFTNSVLNAHRLCLFLREMGDVKVEEFSSNLKSVKKAKFIKMFDEEKIDILVCSDNMARGMDLKQVDYVICYDISKRMETYVHRVGRTARAGQPGTAISFLEPNNVRQFGVMMRKYRNKKLAKYSLNILKMKKYCEMYQQALTRVGNSVQQEAHVKKEQSNMYIKKNK